MAAQPHLCAWNDFQVSGIYLDSPNSYCLPKRKCRNNFASHISLITISDGYILYS